MSKETISNPELFFALVAPIGTDLEQVNSALSNQLKLFGYDTEPVQVTEILSVINPAIPKNFKSLFDRYDRLISGANELRELFDDDALMAFMALLIINGIRNRRSQDPACKHRPVAYVVRQFKRPEEIALFREVYGKQAFQISAYADPEQRRQRLATKMRDADTSETRASEFDPQASQLVNRDEHESSIAHGQRLRDVFPLADVFIDATSFETTKKTLERFLNILFGFNFHSPSRDEYGMYMAKSASLRSVDLSRQVGAAVFSKGGEIKVLGCNEVPSPRGGTYWEGDEGDSREFHGRNDTNDDFKHRLLSDLIKNLSNAGVLDQQYAAMPSREFLAHVKSEHGIDLNKRLLMLDIIEYGRIIHAEMNAITDAARKGISLDKSTLYCTTFPCHLCAKHIISSGINRVVYIEPYPKSYVVELYRDSVVLARADPSSDGRVYFEPFIGIAPFRYRDFFEKGKRKGPDGKALEWASGHPQPIVRISGTEYITSEIDRSTFLIKKFAEKNVLLPDNLIGSINVESDT